MRVRGTSCDSHRGPWWLLKEGKDSVVAGFACTSRLVVFGVWVDNEECLENMSMKIIAERLGVVYLP